MKVLVIKALMVLIAMILGPFAPDATAAPAPMSPVASPTTSIPEDGLMGAGFVERVLTRAAGPVAS